MSFLLDEMGLDKMGLDEMGWHPVFFSVARVVCLGNMAALKPHCWLQQTQGSADRLWQYGLVNIATAHPPEQVAARTSWPLVSVLSALTSLVIFPWWQKFDVQHPAHA